MAKTGYSKKELDAMYYVGFAEGVKMYIENISYSIRHEMDNGTIIIECGADKLFSIINSVAMQ